MAIWATTSVDDTPVIQLESWRVFEVVSDWSPTKTRHFVGYNQTEREGRVSSPITKYDSATCRGTTRSGRVYELCGEPGTGSSDGLYTWEAWCKLNRISESVDVTKDYTL